MSHFLTSHKVNPANVELSVTAQGTPGPGGASHLYMISGFNTETNPSCPFKRRYGAAPKQFTPEEIEADPVLRYFHYEHLPEKLKSISAQFCLLASITIDSLPRNAERSTALRKLLEAKDAAVRAAL